MPTETDLEKPEADCKCLLGRHREGRGRSRVRPCIYFHTSSIVDARVSRLSQIPPAILSNSVCRIDLTSEGIRTVQELGIC